jgi:hypothetical protein
MLGDDGGKAELGRLLVSAMDKKKIRERNKNIKTALLIIGLSTWVGVTIYLWLT